MKEGRIPKMLTLIRRDGVHVLDLEAGLVLVGVEGKREAGSPKHTPRRSEPPPSGRGGTRSGVA